MFCNKCGNEVTGGAFCGKCGARVSGDSPPEVNYTARQSSVSSGRLLKKLLIFVIVIAVAGAGLFVWMKVQNELAIRGTLDDIAAAYEAYDFNKAGRYFTNTVNIPFGDQVRGLLSGSAKLLDVSLDCNISVLSIDMLSTNAAEVEITFYVDNGLIKRTSDMTYLMKKIDGKWLVDDIL